MADPPPQLTIEIDNNAPDANGLPTTGPTTAGTTSGKTVSSTFGVAVKGGVGSWAKQKGRSDMEDDSAILGEDPLLQKEEIILEPTPTVSSKFKRMQEGPSWDKTKTTSRFKEDSRKNEAANLDYDVPDPGKIGAAGTRGGGRNMSNQRGRSKEDEVEERLMEELTGLHREELVLDPVDIKRPVKGGSMMGKPSGSSRDAGIEKKKPAAAVAVAASSTRSNERKKSTTSQTLQTTTKEPDGSSNTDKKRTSGGGKTVTFDDEAASRLLKIDIPDASDDHTAANAVLNLPAPTPPNVQAPPPLGAVKMRSSVEQANDDQKLRELDVKLSQMQL